MAYYMIHTCVNRFWYVRDFLLPSLIEQGINPNHIFVYKDRNRIGNLRSWVDSCNKLVYQAMKTQFTNVWHLQDDVVISKDFKKITEEYEKNDIVCGFTCDYDKEPKAGKFKLAEQQMWYSFPCINISMFLTQEFVKWANLNLWQSQYFREPVMRGNCDDLIFREWVYNTYPQLDEINLSPNIVNHIDKWLGGSECNKQRDPDKNTMALFWEDNGELDALRSKLDEYKVKNPQLFLFETN